MEERKPVTRDDDDDDNNNNKTMKLHFNNHQVIINK
jgi:hypothetical protein